MAKRKAGVNDIIYELDNEDIESSSEDEVKEPKIVRLEADITPKSPQSDVVIEESCTDVINIDSAFEDGEANAPNKIQDNGGKINNDFDINDGKIDLQQTELGDNKESAIKKSTIFREDAKNKMSVMNCEVDAGSGIRIPLISVHFKNNKLACHKKEIKEFLLNLLSLHDKDALDEVDSDTELQLEIWPEDLKDDQNHESKEEDNSLFFVDTDPSPGRPNIVPNYKKTSTMISDEAIKDGSPTPAPSRRSLNCFNCDGNHNLRDCNLPRNPAKIAEKRRNAMTKSGRYHLEDEQKFGHLVPGRLSGQLRHALGLNRHQLPLHIYRMRLLGYPPGWLEEARISHSGITMFDSTGNAILDPEEEEGQINEPGSKDKFDIKKILDFPGFNVPASPRYREEANLYGLPARSDQDSKVIMLQMLAPNAMKAYKRKKLTISSTDAIRIPLEGQGEMELDSDDEKAEFPSVPPLPDDAPTPPPPPPPSSPPPLPPPPPCSPPPVCPAGSPRPPPLPSVVPSLPPPPPSSLPPPLPPSPSKSCPPAPPHSSPPASPPPAAPINAPLSPALAAEAPQSPAVTAKTEILTVESKIIQTDESADNDIEVIEVMQVHDIPMPSDFVDVDEVVEVQATSGRGNSPSLDDLESKKKSLLDALENDNTETEAGEIIEVQEDTKNDDTPNDDNENKMDCDVKVDEVQNDTGVLNNDGNTSKDNLESNVTLTENNVSDSELSKTPDVKASGRVKNTLYGTPVMNIASHYDKLPSDDKFAKDITDVINFENLPNSTGNYKKMCSLLKKVKSEVDRIQEL